MMPLEAWLRNPLAAMGSYYDGDGRPQWQLYARSAMTDPLEFGNRIQVGLIAENSGQGWYREDVILSRGYEACPGQPFVEFLVEAGSPGA